MWRMRYLVTISLCSPRDDAATSTFSATLSLSFYLPRESYAPGWYISTCYTTVWIRCFSNVLGQMFGQCSLKRCQNIAKPMPKGFSKNHISEMLDQTFSRGSTKYIFWLPINIQHRTVARDHN
ncbi:hypothetical protein C8R45DRAFT_389535 [Mycena sanguinolenta]|nr:hypothetical protein C8R45DRAFT_389535 [Mycena sanguinolenta]